MVNVSDNWRDRLRGAWEASGRSKRAVSIASGLHAGFLHEVLSCGKTPSVDNLIAVARQLDVSISDLMGDMMDGAA